MNAFRKVQARAFLLMCWPVIRQHLAIARLLSQIDGGVFDEHAELMKVFPVLRPLFPA